MGRSAYLVLVHEHRESADRFGLTRFDDFECGFACAPSGAGGFSDEHQWLEIVLNAHGRSWNCIADAH